MGNILLDILDFLVSIIVWREYYLVCFILCIVFFLGGVKKYKVELLFVIYL